jgi:hypothetical protein
LRVIKSNTLRYQAFYKSLPYLNNYKNKDLNLELPGRYSVSNKKSDKTQLYFSFLLSLQEKTKKLNDIESIFSAFENAVKRIISCKELNIYLFDKAQLSLVPVVNKSPDFTTDFINKAYKEGAIKYCKIKLYNLPPYF